MPDVRNVADLIYEHKTRHPKSHFFNPETLKFFGERRSEMRLLRRTKTVKSAGGKTHECYVISALQRPGAPLKPRRVHHYFDVETFEDVTA